MDDIKVGQTRVWKECHPHDDCEKTFIVIAIREVLAIKGPVFDRPKAPGIFINEVAIYSNCNIELFKEDYIIENSFLVNGSC